MVTISDRQKIILIVLFCAIFVAGSFYWYKSTNMNQTIVVQGNQQIERTDDSRDQDIVSAPVINDQIMVHVKGAVKFPGVYTLNTDQRVINAIEAAGGALPEGDLNLINLAARLSDGQEVYVFTSKEEVQELGVTVSVTSPSHQGKVNINTASKEQLQTLPGIGPSKAEAIIKHREQNGSFKNIDSLVNVSGIGQKTLENLKDMITIQ